MTRFTFWVVTALALTVTPALAQDDQRAFSDTGFSIGDDAIWGFFNQYGGAATFGEPISRELTLPEGSGPVQLFQNAALEVQSDGSVQPLQLANPGLLSYTSFGGLSVPQPDPATTFVAPTPDQPNYAARVPVFVQTVVPDPFFTAFTNMGGASVWGLPTSPPKADPNNPHFTYQRFQNGVLMNDSDAGVTSALPFGQYLKDVLQGGGLPADLATEAAASPLLGKLKNSDAFAPDIAP